MTQIIPSAEPFLFPGRRIGILLVHGFTGTPKEMRIMGEYFHQKGYTCLGVRLAGHATIPEDMIRSRFTDWTASVESGYHILRGTTDRIYLAGLSMGGALSLLMSTRLDVAGVIAMSTPYDLKPNHYPIWFIRLVSLFRPYLKKTNEPPGTSWHDKKAFSEQVSYPRNPLRSIAELKLLLAEMRTALPLIRKPVLLMHSSEDRYVLPENMEYIHAALVNASDKTKLYIAESSHVITRDASRGQVFDATAQFIQRVEKIRSS